MTIDETTLDVLKQVAGERAQQECEWGSQLHAPSIWLTIMLEEVGEAARALLEGEPEKYRHELVQVAAVAVAAIECADCAATNPDNDELWGVLQLRKEVARLREERWLPPDERADECPDCRGRGEEWIEGPEPHLSGYANHPCPRCKGSTYLVDWDDPRDIVWVSEWDARREHTEARRVVICPKCHGVLDVLDRGVPHHEQVCDRCQGTGYVLAGDEEKEGGEGEKDAKQDR